VIFSYPLAFDAPVRGSHRNIAIPFGVGNLEWWGYSTVKKVSRYVLPFTLNTGVWRTDRQTDRRTSCDGIVRAMHTRRAVKSCSFFSL